MVDRSVCVPGAPTCFGREMEQFKIRSEVIAAEQQKGRKAEMAIVFLSFREFSFSKTPSPETLVSPGEVVPGKLFGIPACREKTSSSMMFVSHVTGSEECPVRAKKMESDAGGR